MTKSKQILAYQEANPTHKPSDIAKACSVATAYVYQVLHKAKKKPKNVKLVAESTPTKGQEVLRKEIKRLNDLIEGYKWASSMNAKEQIEQDRIDREYVQQLQNDIIGYRAVISYLQGRLDGVAV